MKTFIRLGAMLGFAAGLAGCDKKEEAPVEPPIVEESKGFISTAKEKAGEYKDVAAEKASEWKETVGEAVDTATGTMKEFSSRAGETIKDVVPGGDE